MKKNISISAEEDLIDEFTSLARDFWTNRTNLLSMMMSEVVKTRSISFKRNYLDMSVESFSETEGKSLTSKWKDTYTDIFNTLDMQLWK